MDMVDIVIDECMICFSETDQFTIFNCKHKTCKDCSIKINKCPLCESLLNNTITPQLYNIQVNTPYQYNYEAPKIVCYGIIAGMCIFIIVIFLNEI